jgi:hypothetical protein
MATLRVPLNLVPNNATGDVFYESYSVKATNDAWDYPVLIFNDTATRNGAVGKIEVPPNYVGTAALIVVWTATATTGDVEWDFDYRAVGGNDIESLDQAGTQESVNANDTAPSAVNERMEISISLTSANLAAGDTLQYELFRDGVDAGDTMAAAAIVHGVYLSYSDA